MSVTRFLVLAAYIVIASSQSGSISNELFSLLWSTANGNVTFEATYNGFEGSSVEWGAWGVSEVFCGNMFPATMWITYLTASGKVIVEDRHSVGHIVPVCYPNGLQLSYQLSGTISPGNLTLTSSWTRPVIPPPAYAAAGYTSLSNTAAPLIAANRYAGSSLIPDTPCTPLIPQHSIA